MSQIAIQRNSKHSDLADLVPSRQLLTRVRAEGHAVAALNFYNAETLRAHINAANEAASSIILQTTESTINYLGIRMAVAMAQAAAEATQLPIALHLDHGASYELAERCVEAGYTSVMIDGSKLSFKANIEVTRRVVKMAHRHGVSVEGELGHVAHNEEDADITKFYTRPEDAARFVAETGVDALAVAIGTAHGFYKGTPQLDFERLKQIRDAVGDVALVLHGGSGLPAEVIQRAIECGISKINFGTELKNAFTLAVKKSLSINNDIDLRRTFTPAIKAVQEISYAKIHLCSWAKVS